MAMTRRGLLLRPLAGAASAVLPTSFSSEKEPVLVARFEDIPRGREPLPRWSGPGRVHVFYRGGRL